MTYFHPAWLEHQRKRFTRADAYRFAPPGTPEAKPPGYLHPSARIAAFEKAQQEEAEQQAAAQALERELAEVRRDWEERKREIAAHDAATRHAAAAARIKSDLAWDHFIRTFKRYAEQQKAGFNPDQPRAPKGNPDGGQWTNDAGSGSSGSGQGLEQDRGSSLTTAGNQPSRADLPQLEAIANDPLIRLRIDEAWTASNPHGTPREHGFWISRNDATGELFTRPFANPGTAGNIAPGPPPSDAIASFHTHPLRPDFGGLPGPSRRDLATAASDGLPGLIRSHNGMYYFGPSLRPQRSR